MIPQKLNYIAIWQYTNMSTTQEDYYIAGIKITHNWIKARVCIRIWNVQGLKIDAKLEK